MNHILRDIKLSKLTGTPLSEKASKVIKFWDELWVDMKIKIIPNSVEFGCWKNDYYYCYFLQTSKSDYLSCDYDRVWSFFEDDLRLDCGEIEELIKYMVGETLNCEINTPIFDTVRMI